MQLDHGSEVAGQVVKYLEAVDKQQGEFSMVVWTQKILLQVLQVVLNVSLHLVKTDRYT